MRINLTARPSGDLMSNKDTNYGVTTHRVVRRPWEITHYFKSRIKQDQRVRITETTNQTNNNLKQTTQTKNDKKQQTKLTNLGFKSNKKKITPTGSTWGDNYDHKSPCSLRITSHNIQKMLLNKNLLKNKRIMQTLQGKDDSEIHLYQEVGIN